MKKSTAIFALAATAGLTALSATPAMAVNLPFANCTEAAEHNVYNIPRESPAYGPHLDRNNDGFGCDADPTIAYDANIVNAIVLANTPPAPPTTPVRPPVTVVGPATPAAPAVPVTPALPAAPVAPVVPVTPVAPVTQQVPVMPVGGADTGVAQAPANDTTGALALGGGLVLAAAAGGTFLVRRRSAGQA